MSEKQITDNDFKMQVVAHMATGNEKMGNLSTWVEKIDKKLDKLSTEGCVKGTANEKRLDKIEALPKQSLVGGTVAGGGIAALGIAALKIWEFFQK